MQVFCCATFDYCWSGLEAFPVLWQLSSPTPLLFPSIPTHLTRRASLQTFTPLTLSLNSFTTAKQEMVFQNRKREWVKSVLTMMTKSASGSLQSELACARFFPTMRETKTIPSWDSGERGELFSHHSGALDKIHNEPTDRNDYVEDHSNAGGNLTWVPHSAGQRFPP